MKMWVDKYGKVEIAVRSTPVFANRKKFASLMMEFAIVLFEDDWQELSKGVLGQALDCRSCFDHLREHRLLPVVCSDCGRGVDSYAKKASNG